MADASVRSRRNEMCHDNGEGLLVMKTVKKSA